MELGPALFASLLIITLSFIPVFALEGQEGKLFSPLALTKLHHGAVLRVRPKAMTVVTTIAGLLPIFWTAGTGSEVMTRIAAPMFGGMISAAALSMFIVPAAYKLMLSSSLLHKRKSM